MWPRPSQEGDGRGRQARSAVDKLPSSNNKMNSVLDTQNLVYHIYDPAPIMLFSNRARGAAPSS